ncbi:MAG: M24 family metallopeptidase [Planctomycetota bacterium]
MIHPPLAYRSQVDSKPVKAARVLAGLPDRQPTLCRRIGLPLGDPAAWISLPVDDGQATQTIAIVRDLEMDRVASVDEVDQVKCPADFASETNPLSGDRETATFQALARCLHYASITDVIGDRNLPLIAVNALADCGIAIHLDDQLGILDRRTKSSSELSKLREAQRVTEAVMGEVCQWIGRSDTNAEGLLIRDDELVTSERVRSLAAMKFLSRGFSLTHGAIVAGPPHAGDCHHAGTGPLRTGTPIIIDLYPRDDQSRYHGDCTRTVVHGDIPDVVARMHAAVLEAKRAAEPMLTPGRDAGDVNQIAREVLQRHGYVEQRGEITDQPSIQHGLGHGIGLEIHEPILLDDNGGTLLANEVFTVEPGLYGRSTGGVRIEDMVIVTPDGGDNVSELSCDLSW